jgi:hypothetical protein
MTEQRKVFVGDQCSANIHTYCMAVKLGLLISAGIVEESPTIGDDE